MDILDGTHTERQINLGLTRDEFNDLIKYIEHRGQDYTLPTDIIGKLYRFAGVIK